MLRQFVAAEFNHSFFLNPWRWTYHQQIEALVDELESIGRKDATKRRELYIQCLTNYGLWGTADKKWLHDEYHGLSEIWYDYKRTVSSSHNDSMPHNLPENMVRLESELKDAKTCIADADTTTERIDYVLDYLVARRNEIREAHKLQRWDGH